MPSPIGIACLPAGLSYAAGNSFGSLYLSPCTMMAQATRAGAQAMGLSLFAKRPSNGVTSINVPAGIDGKQLTKLMYDQSHVMVAGGQGEMAGKVFRFAHMGYISAEDVLAGLAATEQTLASMGYSVKAGQGVRAAQTVLDQAVPVHP